MTIFGLRLFTPRNPARELANKRWRNEREYFRETARKMRDEMGLEPDARLA